MKTLSIYAALLFSTFSISQTFAQKSITTETIKVWGNCEMCQKTIEKSAKAAGATTANWNEETKQLKVSYATSTTGAKIQQAIAKAGYDTQDFTADSTAYENLSPCCQYDRKKEAVQNSSEKSVGASSCNKDVNACNEMAACKEMSACKEMAACKDKSDCKM